MKKLFSLCAVIVCVAAFSVMSCDSGSSSDGGAGADFDASQYYTKTEVDGLISSVIDNSTDVHDSITGNDFAGGTATGWSSPAGAKGAIMELSVYNNTASLLISYIEVSSSDGTNANMGTSITVPNDGSYYSKIFYVPVAGDTTIVAYHPYSSGHSGITDLSALTSGTYYEIQVKPVAWFK